MNIDFSQKILQFNGHPLTEPLFKVVKKRITEADPEVLHDDKSQNLTQNDAVELVQKHGTGLQIVPMGSRPQKLGQFLAPLLANAKIAAEKTTRAFAVAIRIHEGGNNIELAVEDVKMILDVLDASADHYAWVKASVRYILDSGSIPDELRKSFNILYKTQVSRQN